MSRPRQLRSAVESVRHYTDDARGSEWTLKYDEPEVEIVARGRNPSATFSTEGHLYFNVA